MTEMTRWDIILLSTADWDNPFWTNKQHVAAELARRGFRILYVESLGLRRPSFKSRDLRRILRRLWRALQPPRLVRENLWVWSPLVVPAHGRWSVRQLNRQLFRCGLAVWMKWLRMRPDLLWTYSPLTTEVVDLSRFRRIVYHCVDEVKAAPGMPERILERGERELVGRADVVFATAMRLAESRRELNPNTHYLSNVADYVHFAGARHPETRIPDDLARIPEPRIGFVGAISGYKVDFALLRELALAHPEWSIVLIGEVGEGDPWTDVSELAGLPNVYLMGPRPYSLLPAYMKGFRVGLLPNQLNDYTVSMFPMKFFEYLAAGLPVVSVDLPALRDHADIARLADTRQDFIDSVESALKDGDRALESRLERAQRHTYVSRTDAMLEILGRVIER
jgi:glycosyltransferase involved in cell wall biosynthesis